MHIAQSTTRRLAGYVAVLALAVPLFAAADCVEVERPAKPAEVEFHRRATAALLAALPPAPAGVEVTSSPIDFKRLPAIGLLCREHKDGEFTVSARRDYLQRVSEPERKKLLAEQQSLTDQIYALEKIPADKVAERTKLEEKSRAAWDTMKAAEKAGDQAAAKERAADYRAWRDQASGIDQQHLASVKPQVEAMRKRQSTIAVNGQQAVVGVAINVAQLPAANATNPVGAYGTASPGRSAGLKVHNVVWSVSGPDGVLRQALTASIDKARLQSLVGKPLPAESESEAFAMKSVAAVSPVSAPSANPAAPAPVQGEAATAESPATPPTADQSAATESVTQAVGAVNKLRGLLGR
jgi:hypothetical protein